jgi:hypothetical protein
MRFDQPNRCDMLWRPTIRAAPIAGTPWHDVQGYLLVKDGQFVEISMHFIQSN